jgi:hypothetical protein
LAGHRVRDAEHVVGNPPELHTVVAYTHSVAGCGHNVQTWGQAVVVFGQ